MKTVTILPATILDRFTERCPAVVMVRTNLEKLLRPDRLNKIFDDTRHRQYTKQLLSAYLAKKVRLGVSPAALYEKLKHAEPDDAAITTAGWKS